MISLNVLRKVGEKEFDERVKEWWPMRNGNLIFKLKDDNGVDDQDIAKSKNQMPCHLSSYILGHSKRIMNNVIREKDGFYSNNVHYGDTDSAYIHKKHWSILAENSCVAKSLGLGRNEYSDAGTLYACFLASKKTAWVLKITG